MKSTLLLILVFLTSSNFSFGQLSLTERQMTPAYIPNHIERYNVDYRLVDESIIVSDSSVLSQIDLEGLESNRALDHDVTVHDIATGLDIILFYKKRGVKPNSVTNTSGI